MNESRFTKCSIARKLANAIEMELFETLNQEGITIILVTHATEVAECAKRTIHIQDGLILSGTYTGTNQTQDA